MEQLTSASQMTLRLLLSSASLIFFTSLNLVEGQISTPCTTSMISTFTPCANYITGSTNNNGVSVTPSNTCCDSLRSLMSNSMDCACLLISANVPILPIPISQVVALSLSRVCNIPGVSAQCKAAASPLPPPGPAALGSNSLTLPPSAESPLSPQVSESMELAEAHEDEKLQLAPGEAEAPWKSPPGIRPVLTPFPSSASHPSYVSMSPFALMIFIGLIVLGTF